MSGAVRSGLNGATVALAVWIGSVIFFAAIVAPAAFRVLPTRTLAGALVGATLPALFWSGALVGIVVLALALGGPAWALRRVVASAALVMVIACLGRSSASLRASSGCARRFRLRWNRSRTAILGERRSAGSTQPRWHCSVWPRSRRARRSSR